MPSGNLNGSDLVDNLERQENVIKECIDELEKSEAVRVAFVSQLREALQDQVRLNFVQVFSSIICESLLGSVLTDGNWSNSNLVHGGFDTQILVHVVLIDKS